MTDKNVYLAPLTFGFGPASHAVAIGRALRARDEELRLIGLGDGVAADFMANSGIFHGIVSQREAGCLPSSFGEPGRPAVMVAVGDFDRALAARSRGVPTVMVDALYWMWDREPIDPTEVDRYLCLAFPGVEERVRERPGGAGSMTVIPQILDTLPTPAARRDGVVLNFGGAVAPFGSNSEYLRALVHTVADVLGADRELLVTCSTHAGELVREGGLPAQVRVTELPFEQMMGVLGERALLLTLPGLSIMWEALRMRVPTVVLPGANYSQHRQVVSYQRYLTETPILTWDDLDGYGLLRAGLPENMGGDNALALGRRFAADPVTQKLLAERLRTILRAPVPPPSLTGAHPWSSFDGAEHVAREVVDLLSELEASR